MKDGDVTFIRKNGRVIPIKKKNGSSGQRPSKKSSSNDRKIAKADKKISKSVEIGASVGVGVGVARGKFGVKSLVTHAAVGALAGLVGSRLSKDVREGEKAREKKRNNSEYAQMESDFKREKPSAYKKFKKLKKK